MKKCRAMLIYSLILMLFACTKTYIPCVEKDGCTMSCEQKLAMCKQVCVDNCQNCQRKSKHKAIKSYTKYVREQQIQGGFITKLPRSYRDPLQCIKTTCNCIADYNVCVQAKTGMVQKRLVVNKACTSL